MRFRLRACEAEGSVLKVCSFDLSFRVSGFEFRIFGLEHKVNLWIYASELLGVELGRVRVIVAGLQTKRLVGD